MFYLFTLMIVFNLNCINTFIQHGSLQNELKGGTCAEFRLLNNFTECCPDRDDECYMNHYDTRCYCDVFCGRPKSNSDCCPDAFDQCSAAQGYSSCEENDFYMDNCNKCTCVKGSYNCTNFDCMINLSLLNEINSKDNGWIAGNYSDFWGKTLEYAYEHKLGTILDPSSVRKYPKPLNYEYDELAYDYRAYLHSKKPDYEFKIRNMHDCGSSWAFSTLDVVVDRAARHLSSRSSRLKDKVPSVQHLLSCSEDPEKVKKCAPNTVEKAWNFLNILLPENDKYKYGGVVDENCYPFTSHNSTIEKCSITISTTKYQEVKCKSSNSAKKVSFFKINQNSKHTRKLRNIMKEIKDFGPVQMVFKVYSDFFMYKNGVYSKSSRATIPNEKIAYHSVKVVGWNQTEDGTPYWIAANYWGTEWGENGYFRIRMNDTDTEIGKHVFTGHSTYI